VAALVVIVTVLTILDVGGVRRLLLGRGGAQPQAVRMAVLPFVNLSGDPEQEYLSDGFTQEMITQLGRLHPEGLSVIARTSVMRYKGGDKPIDQIGRELGVDYLLEGSAQREGNRVRIAADLIHVGDQTQLWADSYEREMSGILAVQSEVAREVAEALALELLPAEQNRLASTRTVDPEAHEAYLKGSYHWQKLTPGDLKTARRYFELVLEKEPHYAPAFEGLAWVWTARQQMGITHPSEAGPKTKAAALRAVELDDRSAGAHEALAVVRTWTDWDWAGAEAEFLRALELDPNAANTHAYFAHFLAITGRMDEAKPHMNRALELDPFNALFHSLHSYFLQFQRRFDEALEAAETALAVQPGHPLAKGALRDIFEVKGMRDERLALEREWIAHDTECLAVFEAGYAEAGYDSAFRRLADLLAGRYEASGGAVPQGFRATGISLRYLAAGEFQQTIDWLEKAYDERSPAMPYIGVQPRLDLLRSDPRFQDLLRRMGLPVHAPQPDQASN
jgi:TolB-like protein